MTSVFVLLYDLVILEKCNVKWYIKVNNAHFAKVPMKPPLHKKSRYGRLTKQFCITTRHNQK